MASSFITERLISLNRLTMNSEKNIYIVPQAIIVNGCIGATIMAGSSHGQATQDDDSHDAKSFQPVCDDNFVSTWGDDDKDEKSSSSYESHLW